MPKSQTLARSAASTRRCSRLRRDACRRHVCVGQPAPRLHEHVDERFCHQRAGSHVAKFQRATPPCRSGPCQWLLRLRAHDILGRRPSPALVPPSPAGRTAGAMYSDRLERDLSIELAVVRAIDDAHSAVADAMRSMATTRAPSGSPTSAVGAVNPGVSSRVDGSSQGALRCRSPTIAGVPQVSLHPPLDHHARDAEAAAPARARRCRRCSARAWGMGSFLAVEARETLAQTVRRCGGD